MFKEEERVEKVLKELKDKGKISEDVYKNLKPCSSQPPRLYGLAKVHKNRHPNATSIVNAWFSIL